MCKWTRPFWGTDCWRAPTSLSSAQAAPPCSAGIERARKVLAGLAFCEMLSQSPRSAFQGHCCGVTRGGQQQFATQAFRVHLLGLEMRTATCQFSASGGSLNSLDLFTELPFLLKSVPNPSFTELPPPFSLKTPFFSEKCFVASPSQKSALRFQHSVRYDGGSWLPLASLRAGLLKKSILVGTLECS